MSVPIAVPAIGGVRPGIAADAAADLHRDPAGLAGAVLGTAAVVLGLAVYAALGRFGYAWVALALALVLTAAGMRVVGVVAVVAAVLVAWGFRRSRTV